MHYDIRDITSAVGNYPERIERWPSGLYGTFSGLATEIPELGPILSSVPVLGSFLQGMEQSQQLRGYLDRNGMAMSDVVYPFSATQQFLPSYGSLFGDIRYPGQSVLQKKKKRVRKRMKRRYRRRFR